MLPLLLLILLVVIDFSRLFLGWINLQNAARIAANYAASNPTASFGPGSDYQSTVLSDTSGIDCTIPTVAGPTFAPNTNVGSSATVQLTCAFTPFTPVVGSIFGGMINVGANAVFPVRSGTISGVPVPPVVPCTTPNLQVPSLVGLTVQAARNAWAGAGFSGPFTPSAGHNNQTVIGQVPTAGSCVAPTHAIVVSY